MIAELIIAYNFPVVRFTIYAKSNCMNAQINQGWQKPGPDPRTSK